MERKYLMSQDGDNLGIDPEIEQSELEPDDDEFDDADDEDEDEAEDPEEVEAELDK